jgi:LuxR family transcriptional regulator, maltose regulon positive regulatory protein
VSSGDLRTVTDDSAADHQGAAPVPVRQRGREQNLVSGEPLRAGVEERDDPGLATPAESPVPDVAPSAPQRATRGPLIETKLHAPGVRKEWVQRDELIGYLAGCVTSRLLLVEAPAGFGKTMAVAQWRASMIEDRPFAWISLDRGDDDPARLWSHVVAALQGACPEFGGGDTLSALRAQVPDVLGKVLPRLANELAALRAPVVVVLDDYHMISEPGCHDQVRFFLSHLPDTVQLVLVTRADPPLPLARLRAAGVMAEVRAPELRFAPAQAAALVRTVAAIDLSEADLANLVERTEGWPAGVYLAALSLHGHSSPEAFVRQFGGDNRFIVDFLAEEVLSRQPAQIRQFLARTAVLDRFCAPLCEAVTGSANAAEILDVVERDNLFLVPLDDNRQWYRYHHLFAQALRSQLARTEPDIVPTLHQRASAWHRQSGSAEEAIDHALAARDVTAAVELIACHWPAYMDIGRISTVHGWLRWLGDDHIGTDPVAAHCAAWCAVITGEPEPLRRWLPVLESATHDGPLPDGIQSLKSSAALLRGSFGFDGIEAMRDSAHAAAELESDPRSPWYALARTAMGSALYLSGELDAAAAPLTEALASEASIAAARVAALSLLAVVRAEQGQTAQAQELVRTAGQLVRESDLGDTQQASVAYTAAGAFYAEQGHPLEAHKEFEHALRIRRRWFGISPWPVIDTMFRMASVLYDLGDCPAATALLGETREMLAAWPDGAEAQWARLHRLERRSATSPRRAAGEPLTGREVTVLRMLRSTLSLREIGQQLYLSPNTVKTHAKAIYRKLDVSTRGDAIARGHDIGIL